MTFCPHCDTPHDPSITICPMTGGVLKCPKCESMVEEKNAESCSQCGEFFPIEINPQEEVRAADEALRCSKCRQFIAPIDINCPNCGEYLRGVVQAVVEEKPKEPVEVEAPIVRQKARYTKKDEQGKTVLTAQLDQERMNEKKISVVASRQPRIFFTTLFLLLSCCVIVYGVNLVRKNIFLADAPVLLTSINTRVIIPTITHVPMITLTTALMPALEFTPTITLTTANTPSPTATITPILPAYNEINSQNVNQLIPILTLEGAKEGLGIAFSPDNRLLAAAGDDGTIRMWDSYYGTLRDEFESSMKRALAVAFSPDGSLVYASGNDFIIYSFDTFRGDVSKRFLGHSGWVDKILFHPNGELMASTNGSIIIWNLQTGKIARSFSGDTTDIAFTPNGDGIAIPEMITVRTGVDPYELLIHNPVIRIRDLSTGDTNYIYTFSTSIADPGPITSFSFSPDGLYIAAGGPENTVWWGNANDSYLSKLYDFNSNAQITNIVFNPNGDLLAAASSDSTIKIWDCKNRSLIATLEGHRGAVRYITFSPDGKSLASSSDDGTLIIWRIK